MKLSDKCGLARLLPAISAAVMLSFSAPASAAGPGDGISVQPITTGRADHYFQHFVVQIALEKLGYKVKDHLEAQFPAMHLALGQGDADYTAVHWQQLHEKFFENAGGDQKLTRVGVLIKNIVQGYLIDKKTADQYKITSLEQFKDPPIAKLFDTDGDGRANLTGCNPGWGCERVIEHQLTSYDLRKMVQHDQGEYFALIADTVTRFKTGKPIFYYTWTPLWVSSVLRPGVDTVWLNVPFTSLPADQKGVETKGADGVNRGFAPDQIRVLASNGFLAKNPAAKRLFEVMVIPIEDVNDAILKQNKGEAKVEQIRQHAVQWVAANEKLVAGWVEEAAKAAR